MVSDIQRARMLLLKGKKLGKVGEPKPRLCDELQRELAAERKRHGDENEIVQAEVDEYKRKFFAEKESQEVRERARQADLDAFKATQASLRNYSDPKTNESFINPEIIRKELSTNFTYPDLPILEKREEILSTINRYSTCVISGPTGCGKSLMVPQFILDDCVARNIPCKIVITQPRRIAAISIAKYVAQLRNVRPGSIVGYKVSMDKLTSQETAITYATTGVLVAQLASEKSLDEYSHIIIDEVHERDQNIDFALLLTKKLSRSVSPHTKIILMSATMDSRIFSEYFSIFSSGALINAPIIEMIQKTHDCPVYYEDDMEVTNEFGGSDLLTIEDQLSEVKMSYVAKILRMIPEIEHANRVNDLSGRIRGGSFGSVLIFLPGLNEIETLFSYLSRIQTREKLTLLRLHSQISLDEQSKVFQSAEQRKVIIATNIAESSITVPDVDYIIDFCLTKQLVLDKNTNFCSLQLCWTSKASCEQRRGRAGRLRSGKVWRLCSRRFYADLEEYSAPEIQRCPLEQIVLKTKVLDMGEPRELLSLAISPPCDDDIVLSLNRLKEIGALVHKDKVFDGDVTFLGEILSVMPIDVCLGKLVVLGFAFGLLEDCATLASCLSLKSFFSYRLSEKHKTFKSKLFWSRKSESDLIIYLNAYTQWFKLFNGCPSKKSNAWCRNNSLIEKRLIEVKTFRDDILRALVRKGIKPFAEVSPKLKDPKTREILLKIIIAGAFYPNYYQLEPVEIQEAHKDSFGLSHQSAIVLRGFPMKRQVDYQRSVENFVSRFGIIKTLRFDYSRCIITFFHHYDLESKVPDAVKLAVKSRMVEQRPLITANQRQVSDEVIQEQSLMPSQIHSKPLPNHVPLPESDIVFTDIKITSIDAPNCFWAQYDQPQFQRALAGLQAQINQFEARDFNAFSTVPRKGTRVLAPESNESCTYYRAIVIDETVHQFENIDVFFVDFGWKKTVSYKLLKEPTAGIFDLFYQTFQVKLAGYTSPKECSLSKTANLEMSERIWKNLSQCKVVAKIVSIVDSTIVAELHYKRSSAPSSQTFNLGEELAKTNLLIPDANQNYLEKINEGNRFEHTYASTTNENYPRNYQSEYSIRISGPSSPIETTFRSIHDGTFYGANVKISPLSVNCVALDEECGSDAPVPMLIACHVKTSVGGGFMCNETTVLSEHKNMIPYLMLIFSPLFKLSFTANGEEVDELISGVGYTLKTDLCFKLERNLLKNELVQCEGIKHFIGLILKPNDNSMGNRTIESDELGVVNKSQRLVELTLDLLSTKPKAIPQDEEFSRAIMVQGSIKW